MKIKKISFVSEKTCFQMTNRNKNQRKRKKLKRVIKRKTRDNIHTVKSFILLFLVNKLFLNRGKEKKTNSS